MNPKQRRPILLIALILLHLTGVSQEKKFVKNNLPARPDSAFFSANRFLAPLPKKVNTPLPMGFFCRQEYHLEKITGIPVKFRLGSYQEAHKQEYGD